MSYKRSLLIGLVLVLASFAVSLWLYPQLPETMPRHWDAAGNIDGYGPRAQVAFLMPAVIAFTWVLLIVLPRVSPHGFRMDLFRDVYGVVVAGIIAVLAFLHTIMLLKAAGYALHLNGTIFVAIGILLLFLGNYMGKLRKNFFIGVRTPWTLASDEVWARTHRLAGWVFAAAGAALVADGLLGANAMLFAVILICAVFTPIVYSFVLYRRIEGFGPDPAP